MSFTIHTAANAGGTATGDNYFTQCGLNGPTASGIGFSCHRFSGDTLWSFDLSQSGYAGVTGSVALSPSTDYPVEISYDPVAGCELRFAGQVLQILGEVGDVDGVNSFRIDIGYGENLGPVTIIDSAAITDLSGGGGTTPDTIHISASLTAPRQKLVFTASDSYGVNAAFLAAPSPTLAFRTGAVASLTALRPTLAAAGTVTIFANANLLAPSPKLYASATVATSASASLKAPSPLLSAFGGGQAAFTAPSPTLVASGTVGILLSAALTAPRPKLSATASIRTLSYANLTAPSPRMGNTAFFTLSAPSPQLYAMGSMTVTATYEAYAVNLKHLPRPPNEAVIDEVTRYTNFPFTHVIRYQNSYYGANSTGLYLLEGTTDDDAPIVWDFETALDDFKTPVQKAVDSAFFSGRLGPASTIRILAGEKVPVTYSFTTPRGQLAQNYRQQFGKGFKNRYYALGASGNGNFELDGIELEVRNLTRRI